MSAENNEAPLPKEGNTKIQLTEREQELLSHAWTCMKTQPEVSQTQEHPSITIQWRRQI